MAAVACGGEGHSGRSWLCGARGLLGCAAMWAGASLTVGWPGLVGANRPPVADQAAGRSGGSRLDVASRSGLYPRGARWADTWERCVLDYGPEARQPKVTGSVKCDSVSAHSDSAHTFRVSRRTSRQAFWKFAIVLFCDQGVSPGSDRRSPTEWVRTLIGVRALIE